MLRRTRKRGRALAAVACVLIIAALFPHGTFNAHLAMKCSRCGYATEVSRTELSPPRWIPVRYPGWTSCTTIQNPNGKACDRHQFDASISAQLTRGGGAAWGSASRSESDGERQFDTIINGVIATPESAANILKNVISPSVRGFTIGKRLVEP